MTASKLQQQSPPRIVVWALCCCLALSWTTSLSSVHALSLRMSTSSAANANKVNVVAGATGYIGKSVVRESVRQGYQTVALVRDASKVSTPEGQALYGEFLQGAQLVECDVTNPDQLLQVGVCLYCILILVVGVD